MKKIILAAAVAALGLVGSAGVMAAEDGNFMVRARAVSIDWDNGQKDGLPGITADNRWIPEVDLSYFFTKNVAAELVLTYPQKVDIALNGTNIGNVKALPPSLLVQYHFTDFGAFKPYVGLGLNYTLFSKRNNLLGGAAEVDRSSLGYAAQIGFDYALNKTWSVNVDVKYVQIETDVKVGGAKVGTLDLSPITAGVGVGYRF